MTTALASPPPSETATDPWLPAAAEVAAELSARQPLTHMRSLEIHSFYGDECPHTLRAIGRLREIGFQAVGAGRGEPLDLDALDRGPGCYGQLLAWDPQQQEIVSLYRYQLGARATTFGDGCLRTCTLFDYSPEFRELMLPFAIELGRSVVNRAARRQSLGFFAIWAGLGALLRTHPECRYFFGNVSLYQSMQSPARDLLIRWLEHHYGPGTPLLKARQGLGYQPAEDNSPVPAAVAPGADDTPENRIARLRELMAAAGERIPPVMQSYMALSNQIWCGQTVLDADFGDALEIGIIVPVATINDSVRQRFIERD